MKQNNQNIKEGKVVSSKNVVNAGAVTAHAIMAELGASKEDVLM